MDKNTSPYPLNSSQSCHRTLRGQKETLPVLPTHPDPFIFLLPTAFVKPHQHTHTHRLLTCIMTRKTCHAAALPQCWSHRDDSFLSTCRCPQMACALHARWGNQGGYGKWVQTLQSLKRTGTVRKVSTPHASIADPLTHPQIYIGRWFLSTKPSLHAAQHSGNSTKGHCLLPHSFLPPIPVLHPHHSAHMGLHSKC